MKKLQKSIVGAILGLILSFTMVMFTNYQAKAFTSVPTGYRQMSSSDVGKIFGQELNNTILVYELAGLDVQQMPQVQFSNDTFIGKGQSEVETAEYENTTYYGVFNGTVGNGNAFPDILEIANRIETYNVEEMTWYVTSRNYMQNSYVVPNGVSITAYYNGNSNILYVKDNTSYSITYSSNGGSSISSQSGVFSLPNPLPTPTKDGYTFGGWYYDNSFTMSAINGTTLTSDVVLYAKWVQNTYTLAYNSNGGTSIESVSNITTIPSELPTPTKTGYTFNGWYYESTFTNQVVPNATITSNTTIYAKWTNNGYTLNYNSNGGSVVANLYNQIALPNPLPTPTKENNKFLGWYYENTFTTQALSGTAITNDTFLYAKWEIDPLYQAHEEGKQEGLNEAFTFMNFSGELVRVFFSSFFVILSFSVFGFHLYELLLIPALLGAVLLIWKAFKG